MEPTEFEKWCAGELGYGYTPEYIMAQRRINSFDEMIYMREEISIRYYAYMAGITSMLPYQTPAKGVSNEG